MKYFSRYHLKDEVKEITPDEAKDALSTQYKMPFVEKLISDQKAFRLETPFRTVWTKNDKGQVPMPGFIGVLDWEE